MGFFTNLPALLRTRLWNGVRSVEQEDSDLLVRSRRRIEGLWNRTSVAETQRAPPAASWRAARNSSCSLKSSLRGRNGPHLADKTNASTTSPANNMLAISEN